MTSKAGLAETTAGRQRAEGRIAFTVERMGPRSGIRRLAESGSARLRLPRIRDAAPEGVIINTAGGIAAGDRFTTVIALRPEAEFVLTTAAAEKIYRSDGATAEIVARIALGPRARLEWLPQEAILFDRARLLRRLDVDLDPTASVLLFEAVVFGRAASGEVVESGLFEDRWRVRRGGRLVYADTFRLEGPIAARLARPEVAAGGRALATLLYVAPDAEARLDQAREHLAGVTSECGASAWDGCLAVRWLAADIGTLRRDAARFMTAFRGRALPRVWLL